AEQFNMLVELITQQAATIKQLTGSLAEVRREFRTTVTEIRSVTQEIPAALAGPAAARALPAGRTVESEAAEGNTASEKEEGKQGQGVWSSLQECQARGYRPTLAEIQQVCQVAKKTATTYRKNFYGEGEQSQGEEEE